MRHQLAKWKWNFSGSHLGFEGGEHVCGVEDLTGDNGAIPGDKGEREPKGSSSWWGNATVCEVEPVESNFWMMKFIPRLLKRADISRFSTAVTTWHLQQSQNNY